MKNIVRSLVKNEFSQRISLLIAFTLNVFVITIMFLFSTGIANIFNEKLSATEQEQIVLMLSSIVSVVIVSLLFFQWIIYILYKALFDDRKTNNINFKLLGASNRFLIKLYLKELMLYQLISIPIGYLGGMYLFHIIAKKYDLILKVIDSKLILLAVGMYLLTLLLTCLAVFKRFIKFDVIKEMRYQELINMFKYKKIQIFLFVIGIILLLFIYIVKIFGDNPDGLAEMLNFLVTIGAILFIFDIVYFIVSKFELKIYQSFKLSCFTISKLYMLGYYKKIKSIIIMIFIGISIVVGLQASFDSSRNDASKIVYDHVLFSDLFIFDDYIDETKFDGTGYSFIVNKMDNYPLRRLYGIDSDYLEHEILPLDYNLNEWSNYNDLDNPEWDGIFLPQFFISENDIGEDFVIVLDGEEYIFKIAGGYYDNNLGEVHYLVSKGYLQNLLNKNRQVNAVCISEANTDFKNINEKISNGITHITKEDIAEQSYNKVISGSILIDITSSILFVGAVVMMITFYIITAKQNKYDIIKLRSQGVTRGKTIFIFVIQLVSTVIQGFIIGYPLAFKFAMVFRKMSLDQRYIVTPTVSKFNLVVILFCIIFFASLVSLFLSVKDAFKKDIVDHLRQF